MKIGKHIGKRAKHNDQDGYVFETINVGEHNGILFVYDDKIGHNATFYFEKHPEEWNDELKRRCWCVSKHEVTLTKKVIR